MPRNTSISAFLDFMPATITVTPYLSTAVDGSKTYDVANPVEYPCRLEMYNHIVVDKDGREVTALGVIYVGTTTVLGISDLYTLPSVFQRGSPIVISVDPVYDESGIHHIKLEFR